MYVNTRSLTITRNLESFLRRISHEAEERIVWVDQICSSVD
jgi:hypothetical protein